MVLALSLSGSLSRRAQITATFSEGLSVGIKTFLASIKSWRPCRQTEPLLISTIFN